MTTFVRIRTRDHSGARSTVVLVDPVERQGFVSGYAVASDGSRLDQLHLIDVAAIESRTPMRVNLTYGELEVDR